LSTNKQMKTKGYRAVKSADFEIRRQVQVYNQARNAMNILGCSPNLLAKYQKLLPEHLKPLKSIYEPNARGQGQYSLPWIWTIEYGIDGNNPEYMDECMLFILESKNI
jgi:hypothetical protein